MFDNINKENYLHLELPILILFSVVGMFFLISANNLFILYLALEIQSIALYVLCSINRNSNLSIEAGLKYFIFGSFSSCILLYGISLIYGLTGTLDYYQLSIFLSSNFSQNIIINDSMFLGIFFSFCCILVGLLFKLAVFPFHG
jgi:NADH-quinone oxidoreductase subunit N